jgi:hypothetical protein
MKTPIPCSVSGCYSLRDGFAIYCTAHSQRQREHGHPLQPVTTKAALKPYLKMARRFLRVHASHPATMAALEVARELMHASPNTPKRQRKIGNGPYNTWVELRRLADANPPVQPEEVLAVVIAMALLQQYERKHFRSDKAALYATARAIYRLRELSAAKVTWDEERQRSVKETMVLGSQALSYLGQRVALKLGVFALGVVRVFQAEAAAQEQRARDLASLAATPTPEETAEQYDQIATAR